MKSFLKDKSALLGLLIVALLVMTGLFAPHIVGENPDAPNRERMNEPPRWVDQTDYVKSQQYQRTGLRADSVMGRDMRGRDIYSRVVYGARTSLLIGVTVVCLAAVIGITLGAISGYFGGWVDSTIMRFVDILLAFPFLVLALAAVSIIAQPTLWHIAAVLGLTFWPPICRLTRAQVMALRDREYVMAVRCLGAGHGRILLYHIMPNTMAPVITWFVMSIAAAIMGEASLSFLGLGDPNSASWGAMIFMGLSRVDFPHEWWAALFPALALAFTVLGFNLIGDYLQDALNPRLRK